MGKKTKLGKRRKDRFYRLAKETGYRSRSAFKLLQLNRKLNFLQKSRVVIDLCAAPGGWLQVAAEHTPLSSVIIGVDLVPIKPVRNVITIQADITTDKCRQLISKELKGLKADCVLHDGAPNVGAAWVQDAFSQAMLCLKALKLASEFLCLNGFFITKVFRSRDYQPLVWVLQQLFKRVHATKPQASRSESAEIFVICQGYLAPDKIDPSLLDPKMIFKEVEVPKRLQLFEQGNKKQKAEGYGEREETQFKSFRISEFVTEDNFLEILSSASELAFDVDVLLKHPLTTQEIRECCKDIKVLGKREIKNILAWRDKMRKFLECQQDSETNDQEEPLDSGDTDEDKDAVDDTLSLSQSGAIAEAKQKQRKMQKQRTKVQERMKLKMSIASGDPGMSNEEKLFSLSSIKSTKVLEDIDHDDMEHSEGDSSVEEDQSDDCRSSNASDDDTSDDVIHHVSHKQSVHGRPRESNPLLIQFDASNHSVVGCQWFDQDVFKGLEDDEDEDTELSKMTQVQVMHGKERAAISMEQAEEQYIENENSQNEKRDDKTQELNALMQKTVQKFQPLDPVGLAIGTQIAISKKRKQELEDDSYHRWTFNDTNIPDWFLENEKKHYRRQLPVTKEMVEQYKAHQREINARPIKKVAEAKARKTKLRLKRLKRLSKKAESLEGDMDVSAQEKFRHIQKLYKKLKKEPNKEVTYVVARRGLAAKKARRPAGVKGRYRMVDHRMKKDTRGHKNKTSKKQRNRTRRSAFRQ